MEVTDNLIDKLSDLARLEFNGEQREAIKTDMKRILGFMDKLNELDTDEVEPLIFMSDEINRLRDDVAVETVTKEEALSNAPEKDSDYFKIPKVLSK